MPKNCKSKTDIKSRRYSIDSMLILSRIHNKFPKISEIDQSILKKKLFPVCRRHGTNEINCQYPTQNKTIDSNNEHSVSNRRFMKIHLQKIEFKENLSLNRHKDN